MDYILYEQNGNVATITINREKGRFNDLTVGFCGDLKFGRTVHSLISALIRCSGVRFVLISPTELKLPGYVKDKLDAAGVEYTETDSLEGSIADLDILYMTRVQKERFFNEEDYLRLKDSYILTPDKLANALGLPENEEIVMLLDLGHAAEGAGPLPNHSSRKPLSETVTFL